MSEATLNHPRGTLELDAIPATEGEGGLDVTALLRTTGDVAYDPGFVNTAACSSAITFIDGDKGILRYRGYPIEQLAQQCDFLDTCYLLLNGELPNDGQRDDFAVGLLGLGEGTAFERGVRDHGPGIDDADRARIFEPFFTTKQPGEGLGLGLTISRDILRDFGGDLLAGPAPGGGARFVILLPAVPAPASALKKVMP